MRRGPARRDLARLAVVGSGVARHGEVWQGLEVTHPRDVTAVREGGVLVRRLVRCR